METGRLRPLPFIICDLHRLITVKEIEAGGHTQIYESPLAMEAVKQHARKRSKRPEKRRLGTEIQTKTRCSAQTRTPFW